MLMAKILANVKAALRLSLVLTEVNTASLTLTARGCRKGSWNKYRMNVWLGAGTPVESLCLWLLCVSAKASRNGLCFVDPPIHSSHSHKVSSLFRLVALKLELFQRPPLPEKRSIAFLLLNRV